MKETLKRIFIGKKYYTLTNITDQARYLTLTCVFSLVMIPLTILGITLINVDATRMIVDFGLAAILFLCVILLRSKISLNILPIFPTILAGVYFLYLLTTGTLYMWVAVWGILFPLLAIFLCKMKIGVIQASAFLAVAIFILFAPNSPLEIDSGIGFRYLVSYILCFGLTIVYELISIYKDKKEQLLNQSLTKEKNIVQTMKDNLNQGIFLLDKELKILPLYSKSLISILSYYDSNLEGKNFLDILSTSLDTKQINIMKKYFNLIFNKSRNEALLEESNPISEFEYKLGDRSKILKTRFSIVEQPGQESTIIGILQDITAEKELEAELKSQREIKEIEIKNMFEVIQIDPFVFQDFIDDVESNFNYINSMLKDATLTEKQVITKFFQNVHAIKSNALILGLENFGNQLHELEDETKKVLDKRNIEIEDVLHLSLKLEIIMREKDSYVKMVNKIQTFKVTHQLDSILLYSLSKAAEKISKETQKQVELKHDNIDLDILKTNLRKPIKDILHQCVRNSIYHGIELPEIRIKKNKNPKGLITFSLKYVEENKIELVFSDDGAGLDFQKIKERYEKLYPGKTPDKKALISAIFNPNFSTSEDVNMIAGRGVGLSLIKDIVTENKGSIKISSENGLTFRFLFPIK